jgi:hypothetical protein
MKFAYQSVEPIGYALIRGDGARWNIKAGAWDLAVNGSPIAPTQLGTFAPIGPIPGAWIAELPMTLGMDFSDGARRFGCLRFSGADFHQIARAEWCVSELKTFTWMTWVKGNAGQSDRTLLCEASATNQVPLFRLLADQAAGVHIAAGLRDDAGYGLIVNGSRTVFDGQWHHVAATCDGTTLSVYADGQPDGAADVSGLTKISVGLIGLGALLRTDVQRAFSGSLDDIRSYPRCLETAEIRTVASRWLNGPTGNTDVSIVIYGLDNSGNPVSVVDAIQLSMVAIGGTLPGGCGE